MEDQALHLKIMADLAETMRSQAKMLAENQVELSHSRTEPQTRAASLNAMSGPNSVQLSNTTVSKLDDPEFERALLEMADKEGWWHDNPDDIVEQFDMMLTGLVTLQEEYIRYCVRKDVDPADALPSLSKLGKSLQETAVDLNLDTNIPANPQSLQSAPVKSPKHLVVAKPTDRGLKFSVLANRFLELRSQGYDLQRHHETPDVGAGESFVRTSRANFEGTVRLFIDIVGDLALADIEETVVHKFISTLDQIPAHHGKSSKNKQTVLQQIEDANRRERNDIARTQSRMQQDGLSVGEIEEALASLKIKRLRTNTCVRHGNSLARMFKFAVFEGHCQRNPVTPVKWTHKEIKRRLDSEEDAERLPWGDHLPKLLTSSIYHAPLDEPGDPMFWAPLLALFCGFRLEEALQLRIDDIDTLEGMPVIFIQISSSTQTVKSRSSRRPIPIHNALLELGFLDLVNLRRAENVNRIFTNLPRGQSKNKLGELYSKRFTHYRKTNDIYLPRRDFHSLRKDFLTKLIRAHVPERAYKTMMGHEFTDVTHKHYYPDGDTPQMMAEFINRIQVDISQIRKPFGQITKEKNVTQFPGAQSSGRKRTL